MLVLLRCFAERSEANSADKQALHLMRKQQVLDSQYSSNFNKPLVVILPDVKGNAPSVTSAAVSQIAFASRPQQRHLRYAQMPLGSALARLRKLRFAYALRRFSQSRLLAQGQMSSLLVAVAALLPR
jgi:hypothetical protein